MQELEIIFSFTRPLEELNIPYFITGSMAAIVYGEPRMTHDVDIVLHLSDEHIEPFFNAFDNDKYYVAPVEIIKIEVARERMGHFNLIDHKTGFKADIYLKGKDDLHKWAFEHVIVQKIDNQSLHLAPPEYVILRKLMYYREGNSLKHITDIENIFRHSLEMIDFEFLKSHIKKHGLTKEWDLISVSKI